MESTMRTVFIICSHLVLITAANPNLSLWDDDGGGAALDRAVLPATNNSNGAEPPIATTTTTTTTSARPAPISVCTRRLETTTTTTTWATTLTTQSAPTASTFSAPTSSSLATFSPLVSSQTRSESAESMVASTEASAEPESSKLELIYNSTAKMAADVQQLVTQLTAASEAVGNKLWQLKDELFAARSLLELARVLWREVHGVQHNAWRLWRHVRRQYELYLFLKTQFKYIMKDVLNAQFEKYFGIKDAFEDKQFV